MQTEESIQQEYKLCGFLRVVLSLNSPPPLDKLTDTLPFATYCSLFDDEDGELGFRTEHNVILSLLRTNRNSHSPEHSQEQEQLSIITSDASTPNLGKRKALDEEPVHSRKKFKRFGFVNGNMSVVHQIHDLKMRQCIEIVSRVVAVSYQNTLNARVVVLVDVYLPLDVWSGWQFPKSGVVAAALFRHLSCDWKERSAIIVDKQNYCTFMYENNERIWRNSDCHILGCETHCNVPGSSKKKLFELHEIFKGLPSIVKEEKMCSTKILPEVATPCSGIWDVTDDVLFNALNSLGPIDLVRVSATCRHLRWLAEIIMPCMKLKLYPHQQAAIEWMLQRERNASVLMHPLYMDFSTEDGFHFYIHAVTGEIVTGVAPTITDFRGGMFCDEPGLGKTITALSLILKTQGTLPDSPDGAEVIWCTHNNDQRCGYYELNAGGRGQNSTYKGSPFGISHSKRASLLGSTRSCPSKLGPTSSSAVPTLTEQNGFQRRNSLSCVTRNLLDSCEGASGMVKRMVLRGNAGYTGHFAKGSRNTSTKKEVRSSSKFSNSHKKRNRGGHADTENNDNWVQCDSCLKWRKILDRSILDPSRAWFCSMNADPLHQMCDAPEEYWDNKGPITDLRGFVRKGAPGGDEQNVSFFTSVLKDNYRLLNLETRKALDWLSNLPQDKLLEMETVGLTRPVLDTCQASFDDLPAYCKVFRAFGLICKMEHSVSRWYYPKALENMIFDVIALQIALTKPLDVFRLYLSRATLIVVPANLVDHWKTQIYKHVKPDQLRVYVWTDNRKPSAHSLAWDHDVVITTFNRLSAEWGPHKMSPLMQVHWLRVMLDEGHTLGSSFTLTNKLQMAISLTASNRWLLTGTPTPSIANSQVSHLQPLLKFLHEEAYGQNQKSWEAGILRPFEAEMEEGRSRLLQLLHRCMISARKEDLKTIPPCIKKVVFLDFTEEHARSYNELAVTVRRNILLADWNDPSHVESILNPKQWKFRSALIKNVRLSCCVAGHIKIAEAGQDIQDTMDILVGQGLDRFSEEYDNIKLFLQVGCYCSRCEDWCRLPFVTPCRHLLCLDCVAMDSEKCTAPGCGHPYEMQSPETLARPENPNPKWPVPKDLIELQPSYKQDDWDPDWQSTSSSKVSYLVERLKDLQEANRMIRSSSSEVDIADSNGTHLSLSQKSPCNTFLHHDACTRKDNKFFRMAPEKVIIFSQFLEHIHVIEQQLTGSGINFVGMYSPMHSSNKMKSLTTFQLDEDCMVLLMDGSAALGLDLSFVTHVFLMEPIWDGRYHNFTHSHLMHLLFQILSIFNSELVLEVIVNNLNLYSRGLQVSSENHTSRTTQFHLHAHSSDQSTWSGVCLSSQPKSSLFEDKINIRGNYFSNQHTFVTGSDLLDGGLIGSELIHLRILLKQGLVIKIAFERAYYCVRLYIRERIMVNMGFGEVWSIVCLQSAFQSLKIALEPIRDYNRGIPSLALPFRYAGRSIDSPGEGS